MCRHGSSLYRPPLLSGRNGIVYQCVKAALSPKVHMALYTCTDDVLGVDVLRRGKYEGFKDKGAILIPVYGLFPLELCLQTLHNAVPNVAL